MRIYSYDVIRKVPELQLINHAKIIYARKMSIAFDEFDSFIQKAIKQEFEIVACREYSEVEDLKREVARFQEGVFHIQYEPDTDTIALYITELWNKGIVWPVYDIPLPLFVQMRGDDMDIIFQEHRSNMKYQWDDIESAKAFINRYKTDLVNPML